MEESSGCKCCDTWEEDMYWKHFNSIRFILTLNSEFKDHLVLPKKFSARIKSQMPDKVSLKGPSGALWDIELQKSDYILFVGSGWKNFVEVNDLKENCFLVLKYERNSGFEVLIFDQGSSCEKESAYFVKKCRQTKSDHEDSKKRTAREASSNKIIEDNDEDISSIVTSKKSKKDCEGVFCSGGKLNTLASKKRVLDVASRCRGRPRRVVLPLKPKIQSGKSIRCETVKELSQISQRDLITPENGETFPENDHSHKLKSQSKKKQSGNHTAKEPRQISERQLITTEDVESVGAIDYSPKVKPKYEEQPKRHSTSNKQTRNFKECSNPDNSKGLVGKCGFSLEYISNRQPVTELEKEDALQRANQKQTENSFTSIMRPTGVYKRFFLQVPAQWMQKNMLHHKQEVVLRVGEKTWNAELVHYGCKSRGISNGWKKFALENFLEEFDVLVFKLVNRKDEVAVEIDVDIYRVVQEIVPPRPIRS